MSGDIGLFVQDGNTIDLEVASNDLATDDGLKTAIIISLFTNRRVSPEELPFGETNLGGWWGDVFPDESGDLIGSRLWLLRREKRTAETLARAEEYAEESLQWMLDDGIAQAVSCSASYDQTGFMILNITIQKPRETLSFRFQPKWDAESGGT